MVGLLPGVRYEQGTIKLERGDVLAAFTDGISEAMNLAGEGMGNRELDLLCATFARSRFQRNDSARDGCRGCIYRRRETTRRYDGGHWAHRLTASLGTLPGFRSAIESPLSETGKNQQSGMLG